MRKHSRQVFGWALAALLMVLPFLALAAEAPGALTLVVKDQTTGRPLSSVRITVTERETGSARSVETDVASSSIGSTPACMPWAWRRTALLPPTSPASGW
jgi:hypothetical protein